MTDPQKSDSKAADFLAAAARQKHIEDQVSTQGEHVRAALERQSILDQGGAAAKALLREEKRQTDIAQLRTFAKDELGNILDVLERLPADEKDRSFRITTEVGSTIGTSITLTCHYANDAEAQNHLILAKTQTPGFRLTINKSSRKDATAPNLYFYDYTRMVAKDNDDEREPYTVSPQDPAELRTLVGTFLARATPQRLDEVTALLAPQEYAARQKPPALTKAVTLSTPELSFGTAKPAAQQDTAQNVKKPSAIKSFFSRKK